MDTNEETGCQVTLGTINLNNVGNNIIIIINVLCYYHYLNCRFYALVVVIKIKFLVTLLHNSTITLYDTP